MESSSRAQISPNGKPESGTAAHDDSLPNLRQRLADFKAAAMNSAIGVEARDITAKALQAQAREMPSPGLKPGERAPDFILPNACGAQVQLQNLLARGPVVLSFYRGAWCPYCSIQLRAMTECLPQLRERGASFVAITPQLPDRSLKQQQQETYPFAILSDLDDSVMKAYRLHFELPAVLKDLYLNRFRFDLADFNGAGRYSLPVPATFVIDQHGIVRAAYAHVDYTLRMQPADILAALTDIAAG